MAEQPTGDYIPPEGSRVAINFRDKPASLNFKYVYYHAPAGDAVGLNFKGAYTPPAGDAVKLNFSNEDEEVGPRPEQYLFPAGFDAAQYGQPAVWNFHTKVSASGFDASTFGAAGIKNQMQPVRASGFDAQAFGKPDAYLVLRPLYTAGFDASRAGAARIFNRDQWVFAGNIVAPVQTSRPEVSLYTRYLSAAGFDAAVFGANRASHEVQRAQQLGTVHSSLGTPWVSYRVRQLAPSSAFREGVGEPQVGVSRQLHSEGWDSAAFGERVIPEIQAVYPQGFREVWGTADVKNWETKVFVAGFHSTLQEEYRFGRAEAWNLTQVVYQVHDPLDGLNPPGFGHWTGIENRDRPLGVIGIVPGRVGTPQVENNARPLLPAGWDSAEFGRHLAAPGIRSYALEGIDAPAMSHWHVVENAAVQIKASGRDQAQWGTPSLENTRRWFNRIGNFDASAFGQPFIADRVRGIAIEPRYAIAPPDVPLPEVKLYTRYVEPLGGEYTRMGYPALSMHRNIIKPISIFRDMAGNPEVRNATPELGVHGFNAELFGEPMARLQWRGMETYGSDAAQFGRASIADTKRGIQLAGFDALRIGDKLVVSKTGVPPYTTQKIEVVKPANYGAEFGRQTVSQNIIRPGGITPPKVGEHKVALMGARVNAGIRMDAYGVPTVDMKIRTLTVAAWKDDQVFEPSAPRLSPHTIYAVKEAPEQAKRNHPGANLHYVGEDFEYPPGERFGKPSIAHKHRWLQARGHSHDIFGQPNLILGQQFVYPKGALVFRMGWHEVGDGTQDVKQFGGTSFMALGLPSVVRGANTGPRTLGVTGIPAPGISTQHWAAPWIRELGAKGADMLVMGSSRGPDSPHQWQSLRVGPFVPNEIPGFDASAFGEPWISNRVRELRPQGFDAFVCTYDPKWFKERLRVILAKSDKPPVQEIAASGVDSAQFGHDEIKRAVHFIRPDGNSDQYRKGAF